MRIPVARYSGVRVWRTSQLKRVRHGTFASVIAVIAAVGLVGRLRLNYTRSLPIGLYWTVRGGPIVRGATVLVCLPAPVALFARERGYLWRGSCPGSAARVGKLVLAREGDVVCLSPFGLSVNGRLMPRTVPLQTDSKGRGIVHYPYGVYTVARNEVWLYSPYHRMSFDSRYFGPVSTTNVESRMIALWTTPSK